MSTRTSNIWTHQVEDGFLAFTTGRDAGVEDMGFRLEDLGLPRQTHSDHVLRISQPGRPEDTDAVITDVPGLCLCVKTADCIPVLLYDTRQRLVAAIHAGWRGTVARIVSKTIKLMGSQGTDLHAIIGPGISQQAFEVGDEVYNRFQVEGFPMERIACRQAKWHIDLWDANRWVLEQQGVQDIHCAGICTYNNVDKLYSARRETINCGRNLNAIMIKP